MSKKIKALAVLEPVEPLIHALRGERVMLDSDLARIYGVTTGALNRAVKRNRERFPDDFMFQLTAEELDSLRCQTGILKTGRGRHRKFLPYAFTEQGVAMLSSVLRSRRAVMMNVAIMRAFVVLRRESGRYAELARKLAALERNQQLHGENIQMILDALRQLEDSITWAYPEDRRLIGFRSNDSGESGTKAKARR
jgi:hypothetical protein